MISATRGTDSGSERHQIKRSATRKLSRFAQMSMTSTANLMLGTRGNISLTQHQIVQVCVCVSLCDLFEHESGPNYPHIPLVHSLEDLCLIVKEASPEVYKWLCAGMDVMQKSGLI